MIYIHGADITWIADADRREEMTGSFEFEFNHHHVVLAWLFSFSPPSLQTGPYFPQRKQSELPSNDNRIARVLSIEISRTTVAMFLNGIALQIR